MQIFHSPDEVPEGFGPSFAAVGNFDGVHCGHRAILRDLCAQAQAAGGRCVAVTFDPHPLQVVRPADCPPLITPLSVKLELLATTGVDATLVLPFTTAFSMQSPRAFATKVLHDALHAVSVHEGDNFRFGYRAEAGLEELRLLGSELGFEVVAHPLLRRRGLAVSSSQIRSCVAAGSVEQARTLLGRPFSVVSTPASGRGIGSRLLVPTINLAPITGLMPGNGVYITRVRIGEGGGAKVFAAVTNAGNRPTFGAAAYTIESYLLDFEPIDLTPQTPLEVSFLHRLREEQTFASPQELKQQIARDVARAVRYHALAARLCR